MHRTFPLAIVLTILSSFALPAEPVHAQGNSLLLWPIYQAIESDRSGSALWLENRGDREIHVQIRIFSWDQMDYQERYGPQQQVLASPPFATIAAHQRQLVRLMKLAPVAAGEERAFRVVIDEIPLAEQPGAKPASVGLKFRMRYSLPLFLDGAGIWTKPDPQRPRADSSAAQPRLQWRIEQDRQGQRFLSVKNHGKVHARLSQVQWQPPAAKPLILAPGLLGYVLAGSEMRWPLKDLPVADSMPLKVQLADNKPLVDIPHQ